MSSQYRRPLLGTFGRVLLIVLFIEVINEMEIARLLHALGFAYGGLPIHIAKTIIVGLFATPFLTAFILRDFRKLNQITARYRQTQQNYQCLFDSNPDGVCLMTLDGRFVHANAAFLGLVGHDLTGLQQLPNHPFVNPDNYEHVMKHFKTAANGHSVRFQVTHVSSDGITHELDMMYVPTRHERTVTGVFIIVKDITENVRARRELAETSLLLDSFIENSGDAIILYKPDSTVLRVNSVFESMYGWPSMELLGKQMPQQLYAELVSPLQPGAPPVERRLSNAERTVRSKEGESIDVSVTVSPVLGDNDVAIAMVGVSRDVTDQKRIARDLRDAVSLLQSLFESAGDAICVVDCRYNVVMVNPAWVELFGWTCKEVVGKPSPLKGNSTKFLRVMQGEIVKSEMRTKKRKDGQDIYVSVTASPLHSEGNVPGAIFVYKDFTETKRNEELMIQSDKLAVLGELAAGIGHEIRNPLAAIQGFLQLMRTSYNPQYLDILLSEVAYMSDITTQLLLLARPQVTEWNRENIVPIMHDVIGLIEAQANMNSVALHPQYPSDELPVYCVRNQLKQVLINLIKNAIEILPNGGNIVVAATSTDEHVRIRVSDDGPGIPADRILTLGQPFYTTKEKGNGLGLMISYRIIQNHHGKIDVFSEIGCGTTFEVVLPRFQPSKQDESANSPDTLS